MPGRRKKTPPQPLPEPGVGILSKKHGGTRPVRTYCLFYERRPAPVLKTLLCSGAGLWEPCPDLETCCRRGGA